MSVKGSTQDADVRARTSALFSALAKFAVSLKPEQADQVARGAAKPVLLLQGQHIVDPLIGLEQALKLLRGLSDEDRSQLTSKTAKIALLRQGERVQKPQQQLDLDSIAGEMRKLDTEDDVVRYLETDSRLTVPVLKVLCRRLNIVVPSSVRHKATIQRHLADEFVGYRRRTDGY
jgi:hypothetical protein